MATKSNIGLSIYVAAALPATNDAAGFEAMSWLEADHPVQGPQFGLTHSNIDIPDLKGGFTTGAKGSGQGQDSQMSFRIDNSTLTAGQVALKTAADGAQGTMSIKIVRGSGADNAAQSGDPVQYAQGYVHSYIENQATDNSYEGFQVNFKQNAPTVSGTQPA